MDISLKNGPPRLATVALTCLVGVFGDHTAFQVGVIVFGFPASWNVMLSQRDTSGHGNT
jgi:hypothetical protein